MNLRRKELFIYFIVQILVLNILFIPRVQGASIGSVIGSIVSGADELVFSGLNSENKNEQSFFDQVEDCRKNLLGEEFANVLQTAFTVVKVVVPILMIILIMKDFITAVGAGKEEDMKKAQSNAIKRLIIGVIIFLLPTIVNVILGLIGFGSGTCGIS